MERITEKKLIDLGFKLKETYLEYGDFGITFYQYKKGKIIINFDNGFYFNDFKIKSINQLKSLYYGLTSKNL